MSAESAKKTASKPRKRKPSMQQIADLCGVSKVTVYKALRSDVGVSAQMRQQIIQTAQALHYNYSHHQSSYRIAFLVAHRFFLETDAFYTNIYYLMYQQCIDKGYQLPLFILNREDEMRGVLPSQMTGQRFDGIVVAGELDAAALAQINTLNLPTVYVDFYDVDLTNDCILVDNFFTAFKLTKYLINLGHTQIGFVGEVDSYISVIDRYYGYRKALHTSRLPFRPEWVVRNWDPVSGLYHTNSPLPDPMPTAFVCQCDMAAYYLIEALHQRGLRCPEDVSVISFDNTRLASSMAPKLSSLEISTKEIAACSLSRLLARIKDPNSPKERLYINTHLVERDSVLPPKQEKSEESS